MTATLIFIASLIILSLIWLTLRTARGVEQRIPPVGDFIDLPSTRLHFVERGAPTQGTPSVVMLHGLGGQLHHFKYHLLDALAEHTRVVAVDRPGSGYSTRKPGEATSLKQQADVIVALLDRLNIEQALIVGHSLGGALALTLALHHPKRVAAIALITPLVYPPPAVPAVFRPLDIGSAMLRYWVAWTLATPLFMLGRDRVLPAIFGPERVPPDFAIRAGGILAMRPSQFIATAEDLRALPLSLPEVTQRYDELRSTAAPAVSILVAAQDRILDSAQQGMALAATLPHAHLEVVEGGHMLPMTQPTRVAAFVQAALQRVTQSKAALE